MEVDIKAGRYLEHGEYEGNLYGTKIDSIHEVVDAGKMCILDVNPQAGALFPASRLDMEGISWRGCIDSPIASFVHIPFLNHP